MKRQWENEELIEHWMLSAWDLAQLGNKTGSPAKMGIFVFRYMVLLLASEKSYQVPKQQNQEHEEHPIIHNLQPKNVERLYKTVVCCGYLACMS